MLITATITPPRPAGQLPSPLPPESVDRLAVALAECGLEVLMLSDFGVVVRASAETFQRVLGATVVGNTPSSYGARPPSSALQGLAGWVEISPAAVPLG